MGEGYAAIHRGGGLPAEVGKHPDYSFRHTIERIKNRNFSNNRRQKSKPKHRSNSRHTIERIKLSKIFAKKNDLDINTEF
jgi:hypothetical protein